MSTAFGKKFVYHGEGNQLTIRLVEAATRSDKTTSQAVQWFFDFTAAVKAYRGPCRVYFISAPATHLIKIGRSNRPYQRINQLRLLSPVPLEVIGTIPGDGEIERMLHDYFGNVRSHGEWFHGTRGLVDFIAEATVGEWNTGALGEEIGLEHA